MARTAIEAKQDELYELAETYERLRAFSFELDRVTKAKPFRVANEVAWSAALALTRTPVLDVAAWVKTLDRGWLRTNLSGTSLTNLRASNGQAAKLARGGWVRALPRDQGILRGALAGDILKSRRAALRRLFGATVARRGGATGADVQKLEERLETRAAKLHAARNAHAHRYGTGEAVSLPLHHLGGRLKTYGRMMNDLRLLVQDQTASMRLPARRSRRDRSAADLVDLIVLGTIEFSRDRIDSMPGRWFAEEREAYYAKLHARRRKKKADPFNGPLPVPPAR